MFAFLCFFTGKPVPDVSVADPAKSKDVSKKPATAAVSAKPKVTLVEPKKDESDDVDDSDDEDDEDEELDDDV